MRLGAIIAGADKQTLAAISELGIPLGRAFQIQDDVLNLTATAAYGKEIAGDIWEGKRTLMLIHLLQHCTAEEKAKVAIIYSKRREQKTESEIKYILDLMRKYGSIEHAKRKSLGFVAEARQIFDRRFATLPDTKAKRCLRAMIEFVASREL
jgi:geranylgeranyl diphosphate synthase type II